MNKKVNTILFIVGATLLNLILMMILFFLLFALLLVVADQESQIFPMLLALLFILSIGGSFVIYSFVMKRISRKVNLETYLSPLFSRKQGRYRNDRDRS